MIKAIVFMKQKKFFMSNADLIIQAKTEDFNKGETTLCFQRVNILLDESLLQPPLYAKNSYDIMS